MDLLELAIALSIPFGQGGTPGDFSLDVSPTFGVSGPTRYWGAGATAFPGVVMEDPTWNVLERDEVMREELMHQEQWRALGPGLPISLAATLGFPFEPYNPITEEPNPGGLGSMWMPPPEMRESFPLFRLAQEGGETRAQFMPGYPELGRLTVKK